MTRAAAVAVLVLFPLAAPAAASTQTSTAGAAIDCPSGYVCIYPEINFGGQPWVRRAVDGSVKDPPTAIRDRGSPIRNNSDPTAHIYEKRNHADRCVSPAAAAPSTTCAATTSTTRPAR
ncbi:peptidase inhibitor family I36 protein [Streptomyces sp. TG1A-8]|uniref:peptidase inhibitor family I36 protein n=1 Tax=Streptomyces sp. TG1A-8 TaxID=3051385 RepID=UPI00265C8975|nr:peptidase inhibitor family I36 protein [Streptomyces sp. TG1A-8]MDO0929773.1 peptidase inhibitor family I36 protein [Streptomyces sp. TG1A-8]MDO0930176.1 peptidase inhibitor family I36 protein [Streptomyces sp. TG1A-8]